MLWSGTDPAPSARAVSQPALRSGAAAGETLSSRSAMSRSRDPSSVPVRPAWSRQRAALSQPSLIVSPVRHLVAGSRDVVATVGIVLVRHGQAGRLGRGRHPIESRPQGQQQHPCTNAALTAAAPLTYFTKCSFAGSCQYSKIDWAADWRLRDDQKRCQLRNLLTSDNGAASSACCGHRV